MIYTNTHLTEPQFISLSKYELLLYTSQNPLKNSVNEDSIGFFEISDDQLVLYVADGAGGHPKGEEASKLVLKILEKHLQKYQKEKKLRSFVLDAIEEGNSALVKEGLGSRTTLTICTIEKNIARSYQVGDSGMIICGQRGKFKHRTLSHSPVGYGVEAGLIEESQALDHPNLNEVVNLVGDAEMQISIGPEVSMQPKDTVLLASDGLLDNFPTSALIEQMRTGSLDDTAAQIIHYFDDKVKTDPNELTVKFDDLSFIFCRMI